ncbi:MAG TPA: hypothetical protein DIS94_07575 [Bacteroidetes bacterium]|nr:hypothetical protein [Bacteroidota bacterium]
METHQIIIFLIAFASLALNMIVGWVRTKDNMSFSEWKGKPSSLQWVVVAITMSATVIGGGMFLGVGQIGYEAGIVGIFIGLIYLLGFILLGFFSNRIRKILTENNADSLIDLLSKLYDKRVVTVFCIGNLLMYTTLLGAQFSALWEFKNFMQDNYSFSWLLWLCLGIAAFNIFIYPIIGGFKKDVQTDVVNIIWLIIAGAIVAYQMINEGIDVSKLKTEQLSGTGYGTVFIIGAVLFLTPSFLIRLDIWQRIVAAKSPKHSRNGFILAGILSFVFFSFFTLIGMWAYSKGATNPKFATLDVLGKSFESNPYIFGLIIGAFFSALLNCADTFINNTGLFLTKLTHSKLWDKQNEVEPSKKLLIKVQINCLIIAAVSVIFTIIFKDFVNLLAGAFSVILVFIPTILGLFEKNWRSSMAAFYSSSISLGLFIILFSTQLIDRKSAFAPCVIISIIINFIALRLDKSRKANIQ